MANRAEGERNIRSLMHSAGGSYIISIPLEYVESLKWKPKQKLIVTKTRDGLTVKALGKK